MQTASHTDLAARLRLGITRTARRLRQEGGGSLSPSQGAALATVERHGPLTPSELATRERVQRPTITRVLARLEETGLVMGPSARGARRSSLVTLPPAGAALLAESRTRKDLFLARR